MVQFEKKGKLPPRYEGPFEVLERIGEVAYRLALPPSLASVHNVFHVSMLQKYLADSSHVIDWNELSMDGDATLEEGPVEITNKGEKIQGKKLFCW